MSNYYYGTLIKLVYNAQVTVISLIILEYSIYHPKKRSIALFTMPELLLGVVGVPVISVAL